MAIVWPARLRVDAHAAAGFAVSAGNGRSPRPGSARRWPTAPVHGYADTLIMAGG